MKPAKEIWVEQVLASADTIAPAKAPARFYEKTLARLKNAEAVSGGYVLRIAAGVMLLATFNAFAWVSLANLNSGNTDNNLKAFASEYSIMPATDNF